MNSPVLSVKDLHVSFPSEAGSVDAVRGVSFDLYPGQTLGIVGESGSGKSVSSLAVMGLLPDYSKVTGSATLNGRELLGLSDAEMAKVRGKEIGMIFQDPLSALTPVFNVGSQIVEAILCHQNVSKKKAWDMAVELLDLVGIPDPKRRAKAFPHEFSGGMRQRVVIAIAIANNPSVLIADEPTTALDVTIQAQVLDLIKTVQRETSAATIMITHDMGVVAGTADDVLVMYAGRPVEQAPVLDLFSEPKMPYTIGLLGSIPSAAKRERTALTAIEGTPPIAINLPDQCIFAPRCPAATSTCLEEEPPLTDVASNHQAACVRSEEISHGQIDGKISSLNPNCPRVNLPVFLAKIGPRCSMFATSASPSLRSRERFLSARLAKYRRSRMSPSISAKVNASQSSVNPARVRPPLCSRSWIWSHTSPQKSRSTAKMSQL